MAVRRKQKRIQSLLPIGDSIIKYVKGWELSSATNRVTVKSFSGVSIEDMQDFIKPILRKKPGKIILHIGTNNLRNDDAKTVADACYYKIRNDLVPDGIEAICLEISKPNSRNFIVVSVYRPPNSTPEFFLTFEKMIKMIDDENKELHILGDLNCNLLTNNPNHPTKTLKGILETYQLSRLIIEATRITTSSSTLIDHYITSMPEKILHLQSGVIPTGISDHNLIYGIRKINSVLNTRKANKVEVRNMKRFNEQRFNEDLLTQPWEQIVLKSDSDSMWACWKELFLNVLDKHAPIQHIRKRSSSVPWATADIKKLIFDRDRKKRKAMVTKQSADWDLYKASRNRVNIALRYAKAEYYHTKIAHEKNNPKEAWKTINDL
ncbi:uncharacterized protein LOC114537740 [Dendronephthya gigantea]|uniref:uncharacterized protein LOC114537740 n=1 Tax=Dendronephthya gigantea TaxID=151771 RepID=UPI00106C23AB|nr:uncharacterized protein LOC114537740 [Dendronephthya gigantea]